MAKIKQPTQEEMEEFLLKIAHLEEWDPGYETDETYTVYRSNTDNSYITMKGFELDRSFLLTLGITEDIQDGRGDMKSANIGFNPVEQKWYGWSRGLGGFGIGSEVKKGDMAYIPSNLEDFIEYCITFWSDESHANVSAIPATDDFEGPGIQVSWEYVNEKVPNKDLHNTIGDTFMYLPKQWGRGEWKAETLDDAKKMAVDLAENGA